MQVVPMTIRIAVQGQPLSNRDYVQEVPAVPREGDFLYYMKSSDWKVVRVVWIYGLRITANVYVQKEEL